MLLVALTLEDELMLEWWKDLVRPIRRTDSKFGELRYLRDARFWEAMPASHQPGHG
jgi:hypothetical protein